jgi:hypothetical protein
MLDVLCDQLLERAYERGGALRREVESKHLYGHEAIAVRLERAEDRSARACADLMENPKRPECLWWEVQD